MKTKPGRPDDDVSSAPESGTVRDNTSGNQPSDRLGRLAPSPKKTTGDRDHRGRPVEKDDSSTAGEKP